MKTTVPAFFGTVLSLLVVTSPSAETASSASVDAGSLVSVEETDQGYDISVNGEFFARYHLRGYSGPVLWPLEAPGKIRMLRNWPMSDEDTQGEEKDHPHHRGIFIGHEDISGVNFWHEQPGRTGTVEPLETLETRSGQDRGLIKTLHAWKSAEGKTIGTETRTLSFWAEGAARILDLDMTMHASHGDLAFNEKKDGFVGIRTHPHLRLTAKPKKGVKEVFGKAENSEGVQGKAVWGKRADWVHYFGTIEGRPAGIAFFSHPSNPTRDHQKSWWHARDYGLIAANPFAPLKIGGDGSRVVPSGESMRLRYRLVFYAGSMDQAEIDTLFTTYKGDSGSSVEAVPE